MGINGQVQNSLFLIDDKKLVYIAGNNIVIYNMEERTQVFVPGNEGYLGITCLNLSTTQNLMVFCEKGVDKAFLTVYSFNEAKKVKELPPNPYEDYGYSCKEFLSACFSSKQETQHLITLCGEPDWCLLLWNWDNGKVLTKVNVGAPDYGYL
jgi:hypothetical protein